MENLFASHNDDLLAVTELLGNNGGEATAEMTASINDNFLFEHA